MQKLFAALRDLHPDYEVVDVRFLASVVASHEKTVDDIDSDFALSVKNAHDLKLETLN